MFGDLTTPKGVGTIPSWREVYISVVRWKWRQSRCALLSSIHVTQLRSTWANASNKSGMLLPLPHGTPTSGHMVCPSITPLPRRIWLQAWEWSTCANHHRQSQHHQKCSEKSVVPANQPTAFAHHEGSYLLPESTTVQHVLQMRRKMWERRLCSRWISPICSTKYWKRVTLKINNVDLKHLRTKRKLIIVIWQPFWVFAWMCCIMFYLLLMFHVT